MTDLSAHVLRGSWMTLLLTASAVAQAQWSELLISGPSGRFGHGIVAEGASGSMLLYGGFMGPGAYSRELWRFDGTAWSLLSNTGPATRYRFALAFDAVRSRLVMFGGVTESSEFRSDCWEWDGALWVERTAPGPVGRMDHAMVFDSQRARCVLFGGKRSDDAPLGDTWEWDGTSWIPRFTPGAPPSRGRHNMAFDSRRGLTVLHGGVGQHGALGDTWEFDGTNWLLRAKTRRGSISRWPTTGVGSVWSSMEVSPRHRPGLMMFAFGMASSGRRSAHPPVDWQHRWALSNSIPCDNGWSCSVALDLVAVQLPNCGLWMAMQQRSRRSALAAAIHPSDSRTRLQASPSSGTWHNSTSAPRRSASPS